LDDIISSIKIYVNEAQARVEEKLPAFVKTLQQRYNQKVEEYVKEDGMIDVDKVVRTLK